jgi:hypothetical protein
MDNLGISLSDYQGGQENVGLEFGQASAQELSDLNKALTAGNMTGRETTGLTNASGAPLKLESLDSNLKSLTFKKEHLNVWKNINKAAAYNTVEEFNQILSYGADGGGAYGETDLPEVTDSVYTRGAEFIKYYGVQGAVSLAMQMTKNNVANIFQTEIQNKITYLLEKMNRAVAFADSSIVPVEVNGIYAQHSKQFNSLDAEASSEVVLDLRGAALTQDVFEDGSQGIISNFGYADTLFCDPKTKADFGKTFFANQRFPMQNGQGGFAGTVGTVVPEVATSGGSVKLLQDIFLDVTRQARTLASSATGTGGAPAAPSTPVVTTPATAGANFKTGEGGNYIYGVAAVNSKGESALLDLGAGAVIAVADGDATNISFTDGDATTTGYVIYRSEKNATFGTSVPLYPIIRVSKAQKVAGYDGGGANEILDRNRTIAGTRKAFLLQNDMDVLSIKQLAPIFKMDLAITGPVNRFMVLAYWLLQVFAPKKICVIKNIKK